MSLPNILGKEFECINKILSKLPSVGVGDDCAVLGSGAKKLVISTDSFIENVHFDLTYFSLKEVGNRCAEAAISDIAAMGAKPLYLLLAISAPCTSGQIGYGAQSLGADVDIGSPLEFGDVSQKIQGCRSAFPVDKNRGELNPKHV